MNHWIKWMTNRYGMWKISDLSSVPVPIHVHETQIKHDLTPNFIKSSVWLVVSSYHVPVSTIAKWSICWILAVTQLVVSAFWYIECHWSASCYVSIAWPVTTRVRLTQTAWTPWIHFSRLQVWIVWEPTLNQCINYQWRMGVMVVCIFPPCKECFREWARFCILGSLIYHLEKVLLFQMRVLTPRGVGWRGPSSGLLPRSERLRFFDIWQPFLILMPYLLSLFII